MFISERDFCLKSLVQVEGIAKASFTIIPKILHQSRTCLLPEGAPSWPLILTQNSLLNYKGSSARPTLYVRSDYKRKVGRGKDRSRKQVNNYLG